jgi:glycosyltransferase involved in cell wall biosynthesis
LADEFETIFIGPPGPGLIEAERLGFATRQYRTSKELAGVLRPLLKKYRCLTVVGTGPRYSLVCMALNLLYWRRIKHVQMIHGGAGIAKDFGRKRYLNIFPVSFVTVSEWSRRQLIEHGVRRPITVIGNFISPEQLALLPRRANYDRPGIRNVLLVSRIVALKRVDLLLDALDQRKAELGDISFRILGTGEELESLRQRARNSHANVEFAGFREDVPAEMARADLLVHTCPIEPFGLVILEAMAANVVTLAPDRGGAAELIEDGGSGFTYRADDAGHLASRLVELKNAPAETFNRVAANAARVLRTRFAAETALRQYRQVFSPQ